MSNIWDPYKQQRKQCIDGQSNSKEDHIGKSMPGFRRNFGPNFVLMNQRCNINALQLKTANFGGGYSLFKPKFTPNLKTKCHIRLNFRRLMSKTSTCWSSAINCWFMVFFVNA